MNQDYNMIHETVIRDIADVIYDVKNSEEIKGIYNKKSFKSIAAASSNLTLVFPVLASSNLSIEAASMIAKAMERKAVSMLQILFSSMSIGAVEDGMDYIRQFHTNLQLDDSMTVDNFINAVDKFVVNNESVVTNRAQYEAVMEDLRNINYVLPESISESSIGDFKVTNTRYGETVINEAKKPQRVNINVNNTPKDQTITKYNYNYSDPSTANKNAIDAQDKANNMLRNQLLSSDVKKANELVPTMMIVNFVNINNDDPINQQMIVGVKAKLYPINSSDIVNRINLKHNDKNGLFKFIRATTREISFCRDFLFAIDKAKMDALSRSRRGSSSNLWKVLERRALKSKVRRHLGQINDASAISTLVISSEDAEYLLRNDNIDIMKPAVARPILEAYNLMALVVVNEQTEVANFIFDTGDDIYESISFGHLERENNNGIDRKVINLMTKIAR